jgi:GTP pyrophosphokinase
MIVLVVLWVSSASLHIQPRRFLNSKAGQPISYTLPGNLFFADSMISSLTAQVSPQLNLGSRYPLAEQQRILQVEALVRSLLDDDPAQEFRWQGARTAAELLMALEAHPACVMVALLRALSWEVLESIQDRTEITEDVLQLLSNLHRMDQTLQTLDMGGVAAEDSRRWLEDTRKLLLALAQDIRVVLVALSERVWLMRSLPVFSADRQRAMAQQTMNWFAPLANRLGVWQLKWELEDLSFRVMEPELYKSIASHLDERRLDRERYIRDFVKTLQSHVRDLGIEGEVQGRAKHIYSIMRKMRQKSLSFQQLFDVRAVRVIVPTVEDCYRVLGLVHDLWTPIEGEFDDYIAKPKGNDYQSLHTAVVGPEGKSVEVQIRTHEMHRVSELGVASHWRYKENLTRSDRHFDEQVNWLRQMLEWQREVTHSAETVPRAAAPEPMIYVFTPQGRVIELPKGSTALDFAYHVHTQLGHRCRGARVNGAIVTLSRPLENAERVEIMTAREGGPSRDWLNPDNHVLVSPRARAKVRHYFREQALENLPEEEAAPGRVPEPAAPEAAPEIVLRPEKINSEGVLVLGVNNLFTTMARCCKPVPPESIVGFVTRGRGVSIHRSDCPNLSRMPEEQRKRMIPASWGKNLEGAFSTDVAVESADRQGLLRDISEVFTRHSINVVAVQSQSRAQVARMRFTIQVDGLERLQKALLDLGRVSGVLKVWRA